MMVCRIMRRPAPHPPTPAARVPPSPRMRGEGWGEGQPAANVDVSSVGRLEGEGFRDLGFPAVAVGQELFLVVEQLLAGLGGELEIRTLDDGIDRAGLLAIAAIDAFGHVDVVARRAPAAVFARLGLDRDGERRADRLAQFAGDAALLAVRIAAQRVLAAEARRERPLF